MKEKKYKLTDERINHWGRTLYRIEALRDFSDVKKGDKGGFIEKESNLSHEGNCWVYDDAKVYDDAAVYDNSKICDLAEVFAYARVIDNVKVSGNSALYGCAFIFDNAKVSGNSRICDESRVFGDVEISGDTKVFGRAVICGNAIIQSSSDYVSCQNNWSNICNFFTWTRSNNMWADECFYGTGKELIERGYKESTESGKKYEASVKYVESTFLND